LEEAKAALVKAQAAIDGVVGDAMSAVSKAKSAVQRYISLYPQFSSFLSLFFFFCLYFWVFLFFSINDIRSTRSTCDWYGGQCRWYNPGPCIAAGFCWVEVGIENVVLDAANLILRAFKAAVDGAISLAAGVLGVAEAVLNAASAFLTIMQYLFYADHHVHI
jgi:hypothetical protein